MGLDSMIKNNTNSMEVEGGCGFGRIIGSLFTAVLYIPRFKRVTVWKPGESTPTTEMEA
jgi:hypothetical protein